MTLSGAFSFFFRPRGFFFSFLSCSSLFPPFSPASSRASASSSFPLPKTPTGRLQAQPQLQRRFICSSLQHPCDFSGGFLPRSPWCFLLPSALLFLASSSSHLLLHRRRLPPPVPRGALRQRHRPRRGRHRARQGGDEGQDQGRHAPDAAVPGAGRAPIVSFVLGVFGGGGAGGGGGRERRSGATKRFPLLALPRGRRPAGGPRPDPSR